MTVEIAILIYAPGLLMAFAMQKVELNANDITYTKGLRVLCHTLSLLSWLMVLYMLIGAWVENIGATGYWKKPVKEEAKPAEPKPAESK